MLPCMKTLITTANGMFGGATMRALRKSGQSVRAMVRDAGHLLQRTFQSLISIIVWSLQPDRFGWTFINRLPVPDHAHR